MEKLVVGIRLSCGNKRIRDATFLHNKRAHLNHCHIFRTALNGSSWKNKSFTTREVVSAFNSISVLQEDNREREKMMAINPK